ncbi:MAG: hypothetical protein V1685_02425 [Parcubacteria group bacterium]
MKHKLIALATFVALLLICVTMRPITAAPMSDSNITTATHDNSPPANDNMVVCFIELIVIDSVTVASTTSPPSTATALDFCADVYVIEVYGMSDWYCYDGVIIVYVPDRAGPANVCAMDTNTQTSAGYNDYGEIARIYYMEGPTTRPIWHANVGFTDYPNPFYTLTATPSPWKPGSDMRDRSVAEVASATPAGSCYHIDVAVPTARRDSLIA